MTISTPPPDRIILASPLRHEARFQNETKSEDFDLTSGFSLIRRRIVMIITLVILLMAVATPMIWGLKPTFNSETRLMIHRPLAAVISAGDTVRGDPLDLTSELERLLSRNVTEKVIADLRLAEWPEYNPALQQPSIAAKIRDRLRSLIEKRQSASSKNDSTESIILQYYASLHVSRDGSSDLIRIGFDAKDPNLAAAVPNRLTSIYLEERNNSIRNRLDDAEVWFTQRISEQQQRVNAAREAVDSFQARVAVVPSIKEKGEPDSLVAALIKQKSQIEIARADVKASISALVEKGENSDTLQSISVPENIKVMMRDLNDSERNLEGLLRIYVNDADTVVAARAAIMKSRTNLHLAVDRLAQSMRDRLVALDVESSSIGSALATAQEQQSRSILSQANLIRLQRIADNEQNELDKLEERRRALAGQAMLPGAEVEVLSPAPVPISPKGRGRGFYLMGALLASISLAVTAAFIAEMLDRSIRSFDQINSMGRTVPMGFIPHVKRTSAKNALTRVGAIQEPMLDEAVSTILRAMKISNGGKLPGTIAITSARSGDGKSLVARWIAIELVASGNSVLLVDCDFRRTSRRTSPDKGMKPGLSEFLTGQAALKDIVHHYPQSGVDYVPAGMTVFGQRASLADIANLVDFARAKGQIVIFDCGPKLASRDTMHLVALAERTLLVARWGKTNRRTLEFGTQQLRQSANADLLVAINDVAPKKHARYAFSDSELFASR